jgi:FAD:protein FMN transferase
VSLVAEVSDTFPCFGSTCSVHVAGAGRRSAHAAVADTRSSLLGWHERFSRFLPASELSRLNADEREVVPVSPLMGRLARAVHDAGERTGGLVDGTLLDAIEDAGYAADLGRPVPLARALALAPPRRPASAPAQPGWRQIEADPRARTVRRPPGLRLDGGGLAKGLFADALAASLEGHEAFSIDCAGDLALGGRAAIPRPVRVESPFDGSVLHTFRLARGGVATSGIGRRSWLDAGGRPAHHLLDPGTGRPAFTGVVQVTALAPSALEAEVRAKAALLAGPDAAAGWLPGGGVIVAEDGAVTVLEPRAA